MPDADNLFRRARRICQNAEQIQTASNAETAPNIADAPQRRMKFRREHKTNPDAVQTGLSNFRLAGNFYAQFSKNVRASGLARHGAIGVFGNRQACAGDDKSGGGRNIEGFRRTRTGSGQIDKIFAARGDFNCLLAHHARHSRQLFEGFALCRQRRQAPAICAGFAFRSVKARKKSAASSHG